jgi:hypothetical protein
MGKIDYNPAVMSGSSGQSPVMILESAEEVTINEH